MRHYLDKDVPRETVAGLVAAAQSAATSSNLQLYSIVSVREPDLRQQINAASGDQRAIAECPWFFAFVVDLHRIRLAALEHGEPCAGLDLVEFLIMGAVDAALAAERMVCAAESLGLGICYIGGLRNNPDQINQLLQLPNGCFGVFGLCLGWPASDADHIKPRLPQASVWHEEAYDPAHGIGDYDERMAAFYAQEGLNANAAWSERSGKRCRPDRQSGREVWLDFLHRHGIAMR